MINSRLSSFLPFSLLVLTSIFVHLPCSAQQAEIGESIAGEILLHLDKDRTIDSWLQQVNNMHPSFEVIWLQDLSAARQIFKVGFNPSALARFQEWLKTDPDVIQFQVNQKVEWRDFIPDDPGFDDQWHLNRIEAPETWDITTGGMTPAGYEIVIAVMDSGFDILHNDLSNRLWMNEGEIPDNGNDDDNNGFIDDFWGWDFKNQSDEFTKSSHGTNVLGLVGAAGNNNNDGAGIDWDSKLLLLSNPTGDVGNVVSGYYYLADLRQKFNQSNGQEGAFIAVLNTSFGINNTYCSEIPLWRDAIDTLGMAGVINVASTSNAAINVDDEGDMPTSCSSPYLITVTSSDQLDNYAGRGYGQTTIDLAAPGEEMYSISPNNGFGQIGSGTSFSCPLVSGTVSLLYSLPCEAFSANALTSPGQTALEVVDLILSNVDNVSDLSTRTATGGRLNIGNAVQAVQELCGATEGILTINNLRVDATGVATFDVTLPDFEAYRYLVCDMQGRILFESSFLPSRFALNEYSFETTGWSTGVYVLFVQGNTGYEAEKFMLSR